MPDRLASSVAAVAVRRLDEEIEPEVGAAAIRQVRVLLPLPLPEPLDYRIPEEMALPEPGSFVRVPLGRRNLIGVVWDGVGGDLAANRLKPIAEVLPVGGMASDLRRFIERVAAYTMASPGAVLRMAMSVLEALQPPRPRRLCTASTAGLDALTTIPAARSLTPARRRVLEVLRDAPPLPAAEAARLAACSPGVIHDLLARGLVEERLVAVEPADSAMPEWSRPG